MKNYTIRKYPKCLSYHHLHFVITKVKDSFQKYPNPLPDNVYTVMNMLNVLNVSTVSNAQE